MSSTFAALGIPEDVVARLAQAGITAPFPIQAGAIPAILEGRDVCGRAPTGSGKTLAFGLPLALRVPRARPARPRALVLVPTRELAAQIERELRPLLKARGRSIATFYGGVSFTPQLKMLRRGVDVAVACPGRLADLVNREVLKLDEVEVVVLDEADRMADMGFLPEVRRILDRVRPDRQTLLFSATLDGDVDVLIRRYQRNPHRVEIASTDVEDSRTTHLFVDARRDDRVGLTAQLVEEHGSAMVFCRTKHGAERLAGQLTRAGVPAVAIHGNRSQSQRERALATFSAGRALALVATDVAARGIHVDDVGCVVHFDMPSEVKDYVHRSGRTGRAGAEGVVVSLVTDADRANAKKLRQHLGLAPPATSSPKPAAHPKAGAPKAGAPTTTGRPKHGTPKPGASRGGAFARRSQGAGASSRRYPARGRSTSPQPGRKRSTPPAA